MLVADSYPFLGIFWSMLVFFAWVAWFILLFRVIGDIFRRHDIGGGGKVLWLIFVIIVPFLGVFIYLIAENKGMTEREHRAGGGKPAAVRRLRADDRSPAAAPQRRSRRRSSCWTAARSRRPSSTR